MSLQINKDWMRKNKVDISKYLPLFLQKDKNFKAVTDANSIEHDKIRLALQDVFNQFWVETATWGLELWEKVLDLHPDQNEIVEYRRKQILVRLKGFETSTVNYLNSIINTYGRGYIEEHNERYYFNVFVSCNDNIALIKMKEDIICYKPAHLGVNVYLGYSWDGKINFDGTKTYNSSNLDWSV